MYIFITLWTFIGIEIYNKDACLICYEAFIFNKHDNFGIIFLKINNKVLKYLRDIFKLFNAIDLLKSNINQR